LGRKSISDVRKPEILEHVYAVIKEEGLQGTTLSKIAEHMGVNSSLLIHYFKTKDDIMLALTEAIIERYLSYFDKHLKRIDKIKNPARRLDAILDAMFDPRWDRVVDVEVFYACFYMGFQNRQVNKRIAEVYFNFKKQMTKEIKEYYLNGKATSKESEQAAIAVISLLEGYGYYRVVVGKQASNEDYLNYMKKIIKMTLMVESNQS